MVLPRLENDIIEVFEACIDGTLDQVDLKFDERQGNGLRDPGV